MRFTFFPSASVCILVLCAAVLKKRTEYEIACVCLHFTRQSGEPRRRIRGITCTGLEYQSRVSYILQASTINRYWHKPAVVFMQTSFRNVWFVDLFKKPVNWMWQTEQKAFVLRFDCMQVVLLAGIQFFAQLNFWAAKGGKKWPITWPITEWTNAKSGEANVMWDLTFTWVRWFEMQLKL